TRRTAEASLRCRRAGNDRSGPAVGRRRGDRGAGAREAAPQDAGRRGLAPQASRGGRDRRRADEEGTGEGEGRSQRNAGRAEAGARGARRCRIRRQGSEGQPEGRKRCGQPGARSAGAAPEGEGDDPLTAPLAQTTLPAPSLLAQDSADGDACPVCGSTERPARAGGDGRESASAVMAFFGASAGEVAELRARKQEVEERIHDVL